MRARATLALMASLAVLTFTEAASACHTCQQTPCVAPAYQCVTEMVPYTEYKKVKRVEFETVSETIMVKVADTTYVERQRCVNKPVWDTHYVQREVSFCKPIHETTMVTQQYTVCKPVSTTHQVTEYCMQPNFHLAGDGARHPEEVRPCRGRLWLRDGRPDDLHAGAGRQGCGRDARWSPNGSPSRFP